jgi:UDP-3-O-[3-hydroxymyristoyl] glucosamine N-acyltransferase
VIPLARPWTASELARTFGGEVGAEGTVDRVARIEDATAGCLAPFSAARYAREAEGALARGAWLLVDASVSSRVSTPARSWVHPNATWALAALLDQREVVARPPRVGEGTTLGPNVVLHDGVVLGARVTIGANAVIGAPGFGWATGPEGEARRVPQLGGVVIEDDVAIGPLCTIDAGTLSPTRIRRGAKLDAQVHVGHNVDIGEGTMIAAQSGFAGSVVIGRGVLVGGQAGFADHVRVGDGARVAAKSGVIGDIPAGAVVAGYPAVARSKWLRGLGALYRGRRA